jgi:GT2 family glycosyltransferase
LNNGSSQSSRKTFTDFSQQHDQIKLFDSDTNLGAWKGRNYLINQTKEEWLLFVDSDTVNRTRNWFRKFQSYLLGHPEVEMFIPRLFNVHENMYWRPWSSRLDGNTIRYGLDVVGDDRNAFPASHVFVIRKLFDRLGLFDEEMFIGFGEYELCLRGILSGEPVRAKVIHDIAFQHEHRKAANEFDRSASLVRYDYDLYQNSINHESRSLESSFLLIGVGGSPPREI